MNKLSKILIVIIIVLCIALAVATYIIITDRKMSKNNLDSTLSQSNELYEANLKIKELENQLDEQNNSLNTQLEVFYAKIENIDKEDEVTTVTVEGLEVNDSNHKGKFDFELNDEIKIFLNGEKKEASDLKVGDNICIIYDGNLSRSVPPKILKLISIKILNDTNT